MKTSKNKKKIKRYYFPSTATDEWIFIIFFFFFVKEKPNFNIFQGALVSAIFERCKLCQQFKINVYEIRDDLKANYLTRKKKAVS